MTLPRLAAVMATIILLALAGVRDHQAADYYRDAMPNGNGPDYQPTPDEQAAHDRAMRRLEATQRRIRQAEAATMPAPDPTTQPEP